MIAFQVDAEQLERALRKTPDGHLSLGPTSVSLEPASDLELGREIGFRDYLMEGGVTYGLRKLVHDGAMWIEVVPHGTSRDAYLRSHLRWLLASAGVVPSAETKEDGTP